MQPKKNLVKPRSYVSATYANPRTADKYIIKTEYESSIKYEETGNKFEERD